MSIYEKLYDWQKQIVDPIIPKKSYGIWVDMGLGKTPMTLAIAEKNDCDKLLIVTLNSKALEKDNEKGSWLWWLKSYNKPLTCSTKANLTNQSDVLVINYEALFTRPKTNTISVQLTDYVEQFIRLCAGQKVGLIFDESHLLKNCSSKRFKAAQMIQKKLSIVSAFTKTWCLTGTPFTRGYEDLYSQLKLLGCEITKTVFIDAFCIRGHYKNLLAWQQPIVGYKNVDALFELVHKYAITLKSIEINEIKLPDQIFVDHVIPSNQAFELFSKQTEYFPVISKFAKKMDVDVPASTKTGRINNPFFCDVDYPTSRWIALTTSSTWMRARQISIGFQGDEELAKWFDLSRLEALKKFLDENPDNYVLFYNYTPELLQLYEICEQLQYKIDVYCGEIKSLHYYQLYSEQCETEKLSNTKNIILANYASGSTGKNWQEYNKCILFSVPTYDRYEQGLKRVHRIGSSNTVIYHRFYSNNWLDQGMLDSLQKRTVYNEDLFKQQFQLNMEE